MDRGFVGILKGLYRHDMRIIYFFYGDYLGIKQGLYRGDIGFFRDYTGIICRDVGGFYRDYVGMILP